MLLSEFLDYFEFDYDIVDGQVRLVDNLGAYLGDIDKDRFNVTEFGKADIVDRLDVYIKDYVTDDMEERLAEAGADRETLSAASLGTLARLMDERNLHYAKDLVKAIIEPETLEFDRDKIIESFAVGQMFYERDTEKYIVLDNNSCGTSDDIWSFKVYDKDMTYLYDTTIFDARLAQDIMSGAVYSVTHEMVLRIEPDFVFGEKDGAYATLQLNEYVNGRFDDVIESTPGDLFSAKFKYCMSNGSGEFELDFNKFDYDELREVVYKVTVPATKEETDALLRDMKIMQPGLFPDAVKPGLDSLIQEAQKQVVEPVQNKVEVEVLSYD